MRQSQPCRRQLHSPRISSRPPTRCSSLSLRRATSRRHHLAKLLHLRGGVRITFVHSDRNRCRLLRSRGPAALAGAPGFAFASVPDCLPPPSGKDDDGDSPQLMAALLSSIKASVPHLKNLLDDAAASGAPATCIVSDIEGVLLAASEVGLPAVAFWTTSDCAFMAVLQCHQLVDKGLVPLKDAEQLINGYLDSTVINWIPGMPADMWLRDFVSFVRTTDPDDPVLRTVIRHMQCLRTTPSAVVLNTFGELEGEVLAALSAALPPIYTVGPLQLLAAEAVAGSPLDTVGANLFREDDGCLRWLESRRPRSVVYANFGSIAVLTKKQLVELAMGLANSGYAFLMAIRDDLAKGAGPDGVLPPSFIEETKEQGYITSWCPQDAVLRHEAVGAFLTHCGWNSVLESISSGVPMLCWPFGADQQTNCRFVCTEWRVGVEINNDFERGEVEARVKEMMEGEKGSEMRQRAVELRENAAAAASQPGGPSWGNGQPN